MRLRAATRGSPLARWQAERVAALLRAVDPDIEVELVVVETEGDRKADVPIDALGGKGIFVKDVQTAVLEGRADIAVHSAKDLPARTPDGLVIAAVPERGDPRDALVGSALADLAVGATVATGSLRRRAQLLHARPDLRMVGLRGNMHTRLAKADEVDAVVVAAVGLDRLGLGDRIAERVPVEVVLPQVAQAALAVECRADDTAVRAAVARIEDPVVRTAVDAERGFLDELGGDCSLPAGSYAVVDGLSLAIEGVLASDDGRVVLRHRVAGAAADDVALGRAVARVLLDDLGGGRLLGRS